MSGTAKSTGVAAFEQTAARYDEWFQSGLGAYVDACERDALLRLINAATAKQGTQAVIEIGAGTGHVSRWLCEQGFRVDAVEPAAAMRKRGQQSLKQYSVQWTDALAECLPFADGSFDGALFFTTLEFVCEPRVAIREALRVLRPGGWLCIAYLNASSAFAAGYRAQAALGKAPWTAARFYVREELEQLVGVPARRLEAAVYLTPTASPPFAAADAAGQRAGNAPALELLLWTKSCNDPI